MKWEARKTKEGWGIFLMEKFCKTKEPVCYGVGSTEESVKRTVERLNNPIYVEKI
jgi:hypothetical protein